MSIPNRVIPDPTVFKAAVRAVSHHVPFYLFIVTQMTIKVYFVLLINSLRNVAVLTISSCVGKSGGDGGVGTVAPTFLAFSALTSQTA